MNLMLKIRNLKLFLFCLWSIFRYGRRNNIHLKPKKVLVVQLAKLGDMVCMTPVFRAIRKNLPEAKIYVLGDKVNREVLKGSRDVDEYLVFDGDIEGTAKRLAEEGIEVALIRGTSFVGLSTTILSGIRGVISPRVSGGVALATRTYLWLLPFVKTVTFKFGEYMPRQFLFLLEPMGIHESDTTKHLSYSPQSEERVQEMMRENGLNPETDFLVGLSPSAGNEIKEWPGERFAQVAEHLMERYGVKIVLLGGPKDERQAQAVLSNMKSRENVINLQGVLEIEEMKALMAKLKFFLAADTGPIYIAEAFGVPTVDIIGPVDEREQPPLGERHISVYLKDRERAVMNIMNARIIDLVEARRQVVGITTEMVIEAVDELMLRLKTHG